MSRIASTLEPRQKSPRVKNPKHEDQIRDLPCILCGAQAEVAHVRFGDKAYFKRDTGMGERPKDTWGLPLCPNHHRLLDESQHMQNERHWWFLQDVNPLRICCLLAVHSGDREAMLSVVRSKGHWDQT